MKKDNRIILGLSIIMLIIFIFAEIVMIPYMENCGILFLQIINMMWIFLTSWFIIIFKKFEKKNK
jgi:hypothetical protein